MAPSSGDNDDACGFLLPFSVVAAGKLRTRDSARDIASQAMAPFSGDNDDACGFLLPFSVIAAGKLRTRDSVSDIASQAMASSSGDNDNPCEKALTKAASDGNLCRLECDPLAMFSSNMDVLAVLRIAANFGHLEYAELHTRKRRFTDLALAFKEIEDETDRLMGRSKQISPVPIHLSIYSPHVVNLTLIGLLGLTKVAIEWQLASIAQDIENMACLYVERPNCIILATSLANQDIVTSDAIKLAWDADPTGERTFGMLTKLDLMDKGTNALDVHYVLKELVRKCKCKYLVEQLKEDINAPGYGAVALGSTPFMVSAQSGGVASVKCFLDHAGDDKGHTVLHHAVAAGCCKVTEFLLSNGVLVDTDYDARGTPANVAVVNEQDKTLKILLDHPAKAFSKYPSPITRSTIKNASIFTYVALLLFIFSSFISSVSAEVPMPKCRAHTINCILPRNTCPVIQLTSDHWLHSKRESKFFVSDDVVEHEVVLKHYKVHDSLQEFDSLGYIFGNESTSCDWLLRLSIMSLWLVVWKLRQNQRVKFLLGGRSLILVWIDTLVLSIFYHMCWILYGHLLSKSNFGDKSYGEHIYHNNIFCCALFLSVLILLLGRHRTAQAPRYLCVRLLGLLSFGLLFYCLRGVQPDEDNISRVGAIGFGAMILMYIMKSFTIVGVKMPTMLLNILTFLACLRCEHHHLQSWYGRAFLASVLYKIMETAKFVYMLYREREAGGEGELHRL